LTLLLAIVTPGHITLVTFVLWAVVLRGSDTPNTQAYERLLVGQSLSGLDCLDGSLARNRNAVTDLGGFLDLFNDFIVYSLLPIAIYLGQDFFLRRLDGIGFVQSYFLRRQFRSLLQHRCSRQS
jgi:phosphatidylglycerophosphate synthase